ncbi:MAG: putative Ig domain-containing protein, partial [Massiliimalia sp.]
MSIKGSGSLDVEPKGSNSGITLCSSKNTNLDIDGADVTASSPAQYGVYLISSTDTTSTSTITVNNGSLTTGGNGNVGIYYYWSGTSNAGTSSLTVSGNAVVDTRNSQIMAQNKETVVQVGAGSDGNGGIVFNGKNGTVYGDVTLDENLTIGKDETLTIPDNSSLNSNGNLTNNGTIINNGTLTGEVGGSGTVTPKITTESPLPNGTVGTAYSQKLTANGTAPITWSCSDLPAWLKLDSSTGVISGIPNAAGTYNFTVTAANDSGSDSKELTLKINAVSVSDVTLDKTELSLYVGNTETLNVTVKPNNATNKNVIWKSSNEKVATVENGKVTAKAPGKAIITVTTIDGSKTATCEVTVVRKNSGIIIIPPTTNGNWRQTPIGWWYQNPDGTYPANQWRYLDSGKGYKAWYWFNQYGYMTTGWQKVGNTWYYMNRSGEMQTGWVFVNSQWYYLNSSGAMLTGWVYDGGKWYYMNKDGSMHFGWLSWAGYWYHLDSHGAM